MPFCNVVTKILSWESLTTPMPFLLVLVGAGGRGRRSGWDGRGDALRYPHRSREARWSPSVSAVSHLPLAHSYDS